MPSVFLAGPFCGNPAITSPAWMAECLRLRRLGYEVVFPAEFARELHPGSMHWTCREVAALMECDQLATVPGWTGSPAADLLVHLARRLRKPVHSASELRAAVA